MRGKMRLNKFLSNSGIASRRKCDEIIKDGKVCVNGKVVTELGRVINEKKDKVEVEGKIITLPSSFVYIKLNKPKGYACSANDEKGRKIIYDLVDTKERLFSIGRLDYNTEGLIILTNDGDFANKVAHPKISFANGVRLGILLYGYNVSPYFSKDGVKNKLRVVRNDFYQKKYRISDTYTNISLAIAPAFRMYTYILQIKTIAKGSFVGYGATYEAKKEMKIAILPIGYANGIASKYVLIHGKRYNVVGEIKESELAVLRKGVVIDGQRLPSARVESLGFENGVTRLSIVIDEGQNRQIRRMFEAIGREIKLLKRVRIGGVSLGGLKRGEWRDLTENELNALVRER